MIHEVLVNLARYFGLLLLVVGGVFEIIGAVGVLKLPSFYLRAHAVTMTVVGGSVTPLIGLAIVSIAERGLEGVYLAATCTVVAILILVTAPTGSHALVRASILADPAQRRRLERESSETGDSGRGG